MPCWVVGLLFGFSNFSKFNYVFITLHIIQLCIFIQAQFKIFEEINLRNFKWHKELYCCEDEVLAQKVNAIEINSITCIIVYYIFQAPHSYHSLLSFSVLLYKNYKRPWIVPNPFIRDWSVLNCQLALRCACVSQNINNINTT